MLLSLILILYIFVWQQQNAVQRLTVCQNTWTSREEFQYEAPSEPNE